MKRENTLRALHPRKLPPPPGPTRADVLPASKEIGSTWQQGRLPKLPPAGVVQTSAVQKPIVFGTDMTEWSRTSAQIGREAFVVKPEGAKFNRKDAKIGFYQKNLSEQGGLC